MGKRGPKPQAGNREKNGRLSRRPIDITSRLAGQLDQEERETLRVGTEARHRLHGISPELCRDTKAGSFVGRLAMSGELTPQQYEAAKLYLEQYQDMAIAVGSPRQPGAVNPNATRGSNGDYENVERSRIAMTNWKAAVDALQERQNELRGAGAIIAALQYCVLDDREHYHLVGWLRIGLNALARHYRIGDKIKVA